jgi:phosphatidylinositol dimannoside acyltransferase
LAPARFPPALNTRRPSLPLRAYRTGLAAASVVPAPVGEALAVGAGVAISRGSRWLGPLGRMGPMAAFSRRRALVARHLERVYGRPLSGPQLNRLVDQVFASYGRYWADSLRLPSLGADEIRAGIAYEGHERIMAGVAAGRGTILALPHLGGWEWAGTHLGLDNPISVVVERLEPPDLFDWFVAFREQLGMQVIPTGPKAAAQCVKALSDNHILCLLSDRSVGDAACVDVRFFGETTRIPAGPATLALRTGAALLPSTVYFEGIGAHHLGFVREPIPCERSGRLRADVQRVTQKLVEEFEFLIRRAPTQWHMLQPIWPGDEDVPT